MIKVHYTICIGDHREDSGSFVGSNEKVTKELKDLRHRQQLRVRSLVDRGIWNESRTAGQYSVTLKLYSNDLVSEELEKLEKEVNDYN